MAKTGRTKRLCNNCGQIFYGETDSLLCQDCANLGRKKVVQTRICQDCGCNFEGGPRAKRCPACRKIVSAEMNKKSNKHDTKRPFGSIDTCQICGKQYIVKSGRQKYCSQECQHEGVLKWQRNKKPEYNKRPDVIQKRKLRREQRRKVCTYCLRPFWTNTSTSLCSQYCREHQDKLKQCQVDINRGRNRNLDRYIADREAYRKIVAQEMNDLK